jgi:hypothetical protein
MVVDVRSRVPEAEDGRRRVVVAWPLEGGYGVKKMAPQEWDRTWPVAKGSKVEGM